MRYFHRTSLPLDDVLDEADRYFDGMLDVGSAGSHDRVFSGAIGHVTVKVQAEGGHYTLVTVNTDQVGESEADKLAKRFLTMVHKREQPDHLARGAY